MGLIIFRFMTSIQKQRENNPIRFFYFYDFFVLLFK